MEECNYCSKKAFIFVSNDLHIESGNYCFFEKNDIILININDGNISYKKQNPIIIINKQEQCIFILYEHKIDSYLSSLINSENNYISEMFFNEYYSQCSQEVSFNWDNYLENIKKLILKYETFDKIILINNNKLQILTKEYLNVHYEYL